MTLALESVSPASIVVSVSLPEIVESDKMLLSAAALKKSQQEKPQEKPQDVHDNNNAEDSVAIEGDDKENAESAVEEANQALTQDPVEESEATMQTKSKKHVRFDAADVLEFEPSAWTATVSSDGIPVR